MVTTKLASLFWYLWKERCEDIFQKEALQRVKSSSRRILQTPSHGLSEACNNEKGATEADEKKRKNPAGDRITMNSEGGSIDGAREHQETDGRKGPCHCLDCALVS